MFKLKWVATTVAFAMALGYLSELPSFEDEEAKKEVARTPAQKIFRQEEFQYEKSGSVKFDFSENEIDQKINGKLFIDWTDEKVATLSLTIGDEHPTVFLKAHFQKDFQLKCYEAPKDLTEKESEAMTLLRDLLLNYSFQTNRDENGEYAASLKSESVGVGVTQTVKIKTRYLDPEKAALKVERSLHEFYLAPRLVKAKGEEHFQLENNGKSAYAKVRYQLWAVERPIAKAIFSSERAMGECLKDFQMNPPTLSKAKSEDLKESLMQIKLSNRGDQLNLSRKIVKALRSNPALLSEFMMWVSTIKANRQLSALALGMLGTLGTPEAQRELVSLFQNADEKTSHLQYQSLNSFTLTKAPLTFESREFLKSRINEPDALAEGAAYALGSSIQNNREALEGQRDLQFLVAELDQAIGPQTKLIYLDALTNSGSAEAVSAYKKYLASDDLAVREKAALALKGVENREDWR